jgi:SAM-dependent methyltransferase
MKKLLLHLFHTCLNNRIFYKLIQIFIWEKWTFDARKISRIISPSNTVISGLFKGMQYPNLESAGSALLPKIIGNYEDELQDSFTRLLKNTYTEILDIGCAEGYFAVGFAMKQKGAKVYAYDTDAKAISLCKAMAEKNNVSAQMVYGGTCTAYELAAFKFSGRSLILSDCEGYEKELFTTQNIGNLKNSDIVIEVHDMYA